MKLLKTAVLGCVEGVAPVVVDGVERILLISDNGNSDKKVPANYMFLEYHQLRNKDKNNSSSFNWFNQ